MLPTCLSCHVKNNGMIAIHQHPNGLDEMFLSVTGIEVEPKDHLCVPCYDDLKSAHHFKQRCIQNNVIRFSAQASKTQPQPPAEQSASSSPDVSTTCDETNRGMKVPTVDTKHDDEEKRSQTKAKKQEKDLKADSLADDGKQEQIEYVIDMVIAHPDENVEPEEEEDEFSHLPVQSGDEMDESTPAEKLHCEECSEPFKTIALLDEHRQTHVHKIEQLEEESEAPPKASPRLPKVHSLMCEFCFKEFHTLTEKIDHAESHRSEKKPFKCFHVGCSSNFKDRVGLRAHVRIHATVKRFGCRYCSMRFHTRGNRNAHERTHNGEKPFLCPKCGKGFAEGGNLKSHIRFHNGERPYPCTMCDKSYRTHYSRSVHMRSHTNERPFVCDDCGKGFYSSGKLTIHRRIHTGERPYGCGSCDARFIDKCGLRRHQLKTH